MAGNDITEGWSELWRGSGFAEALVEARAQGVTVTGVAELRERLGLLLLVRDPGVGHTVLVTVAGAHLRCECETPRRVCCAHRAAALLYLQHRAELHDGTPETCAACAAVVARVTAPQGAGVASGAPGAPQQVQRPEKPLSASVDEREAQRRYLDSLRWEYPAPGFTG